MALPNPLNKNFRENRGSAWKCIVHVHEVHQVHQFTSAPSAASSAKVTGIASSQITGYFACRASNSPRLTVIRYPSPVRVGLNPTDLSKAPTVLADVSAVPRFFTTPVHLVGDGLDSELPSLKFVHQVRQRLDNQDLGLLCLLFSTIVA